MDLLSWLKGKISALQPLVRGVAPALMILALIAGLTPVADTLWAEVLTVSGEIETGEFEESPTPTETETPTPTPSSTPTLTGPGQAGTSIEAQKVAAARWKEGATGQIMIVYGRICVWNIGERFTEGLAVFDQIEIKPRQQQWQPLPGANQLIIPAEPIPPGESRCYDYEIEAPYRAQTSYRNSARVTILNHSGWLPGGNHCPGPQPCPFGPEIRADFEPPALQTETPTPTADARRGLPPIQPTATFTPTATATSTAIPSPTQPPAGPPPVQPSPTTPPTDTPPPTVTPPATITLSPTAALPQASETPTPTATPPPPTATPLPTSTPLPPTDTPPPPPPTNTPPVNPPPPGPPPIHEP